MGCVHICVVGVLQREVYFKELAHVTVHTSQSTVCKGRLAG